MTFPTRLNSGVTIIEPEGKIVLAGGADTLHDSVEHVLEEGSRKIVLNLENVTFMDSTGVGKLVHCLTTTTNRDGTLKLLKIPRRIYDVLEITQVLQLFGHFDDEDEAIASFE
jgi:anti-sigma B factor antagonist